MKLFLASSLDKSASLLQEKLSGSLKNKKVLFIANAADNHTGDKWWIQSDRETFKKLDCEVTDIDLRSISKDNFANNIKESDILHFCGGSVLYLISLIREKDMQQIIIDAVRDNEILYTGTSAGSMIVAQDLSLSAFDPGEETPTENIKDFSGLGLTNFIVWPHTNNKEFAEDNKKIIEKLPDYNQPLIFLYDNQAVWVEDEKFEILNT